MSGVRGWLSVAALLALGGVAVAGEGILGRLEAEIREVAEKAGPAVVRVTVRRRLRLSPPGPGPEIRLPQILTASSTVGTGILISGKGRVLTSSLVAEGASEAEVEFPCGVIRPAKVLGSDSFFPVALLAVEPVPGVEPLAFSPEPEVPAPALGVFLGSPLGRARNVSLAIVTSTRQASGLPGGYDNYFVMNAPIHPGDIGGPLLDAEGRVRGMGVGHAGSWRRVFATRDGGAVRVHTSPSIPGMGFGVPAGDLAYAVREIETHGRVREGKLGVFVRPGTLEVTRVRPGSPAAAAGFRSGDVFLAAGPRELARGEDLRFLLRRTPVGVPVRFRVRRDGEEIEIGSSLAELPPDLGAVLPGLALAGKDDLRVLSVDDRLARSGIRAGDVIVALLGRRVESPRDLARLLALLPPPTPLRLTVRRGAETVSVTLPR